ncbi:MAG TPA: IPT/TIG domain-containing protein, partial [Solirubrobacteraceae bacterium]|nr:IPT/TIG domain-containing protein [Solirubrobacteraceae bacterium]
MALLLASCLLAAAPGAAARAHPPMPLPAPVAPGVRSAGPVTLGAVDTTFYPNPRDRGRFDVSQLDRPIFSQEFPAIDFDPPTSLQKCRPASGVDELTRPYTDVLRTGSGRCTLYPAEGNGARAGLGGLFEFEAVNRTTLRVPERGEVTFDIYADDGWTLAIGPSGRLQPERLSGPLSHAPGRGPLSEYPVVGASNGGGSPRRERLTVSFPAAGTYPVELDYTECCGGQEVLLLGASLATPIPPPRPPTPLTVTRLSPAGGPGGGGTAVVIHGTGFATGPGATAFRFGQTGALAGRVSCTNSSQCTALAPPGTGVADVIATVNGVHSPVSSGDRYSFAGAPPGELVEIEHHFDAPDGSPLRLSTPAPHRLSDFPIGFELVPGLTLTARWRQGEPRPDFGELEAAHRFLHIDEKERFSASCVCGLRGETGVFDGTRLRIGAWPIGPPELDGEGADAVAAFPLVEGSFDVPPSTLRLGASPVEIGLDFDATLSVELYLERAVEFALEDFSEGVVAGASEIASGGGDTALVTAALALQRDAELAAQIESYAQLVRQARALWDLISAQLPSLSSIATNAVSSEAWTLLKRLRERLGHKLAELRLWLEHAVLAPVKRAYEQSRWQVSLGGAALLGGAGETVSHGWRFTDLFAPGAAPPSGSFEAIEPRSLPLVHAVGSARGLGFGSIPLSRREALRAARALVKYELPAATVRPLLVGPGAPRPNGTLCVAAGRLGEAASPHRRETAVIELSGPRYRGFALIRIQAGVGGGCIGLPRSMAPGRWTVGIVAYSPHASGAAVLVDAYRFTEPWQASSSGGSTPWLLIGLGAGAAVVLLVGATLLLAGGEARRWRPLATRPAGRAAAAVRGTAPWTTTELVAVGLGVALGVFLLGTGVAVATGHPPPAPLWAAGSAVTGALLGLLLPAPGTGAARPERADADTDGTDAGEMLAAVRRAAAARPAPETRALAGALLVFFVLSLSLAIALDAGLIVPAPRFAGTLEGVATATLALASASGFALLGLFAPTPSVAH